MENTKFNGYANYQTWSVALWIDNDHAVWTEISHIAAQFKDKPETAWNLGNAIRDYFEERNVLDNQPASIYTDLLQSALSLVDWQEVAGHVIGYELVDDEFLEEEQDEVEKEMNQVNPQY